MKIGIDFGTSFSLPATTYLDQNIILLPGGKYGIPSTFFYNNSDGILIGEEAERAGQGNDAKFLKREIKLELNSTFTADRKTFSGKQIASHILRYIKDNAIEIATVEKLINEPLEGVVISVPAAFKHNEKEIIREAAELPVSQGGPGLKLLGFIKEPVAAALAYFKESLADKTKILVYDLGGGTCDVAIVEANSSLKEKYKVIDSGMLRIGGKDWDNKLQAYITHEIEKQSGKSISDNPGYMEKIKREAITAKHSFSEKIAGKYRDTVKARVEIDGKIYQIPITKAMFDELTLDLFNQTIVLTKEILNKNSDSYIDRIICVGGSSKMPQIQEGLERAFPNKTIQIYEPEKAIALGAAIYAQHCDSQATFLSDISPFSYGVDCIENYEKDPNKHIIVNMIKKGNRLPITQKHGFATSVDNQKTICFKIIENDKKVNSYDYIKDSSPYIMKLNLDLPANMPKDTPATLYITLTESGMIEATADDGNGRTITVNKQLFF